MKEKLQRLIDDHAELASRGFNHPAADEISGRMRVCLEQCMNEAGDPPPEPDSLQVQLAGLASACAAISADLVELKAAVDALHKP